MLFQIWFSLPSAHKYLALPTNKGDANEHEPMPPASGPRMQLAPCVIDLFRRQEGAKKNNQSDGRGETWGNEFTVYAGLNGHDGNPPEDHLSSRVG